MTDFLRTAEIHLLNGDLGVADMMVSEVDLHEPGSWRVDVLKTRLALALQTGFRDAEFISVSDIEPGDDPDAAREDLLSAEEKNDIELEVVASLRSAALKKLGVWRWLRLSELAWLHQDGGLAVWAMQKHLADDGYVVNCSKYERLSQKNADFLTDILSLTAQLHGGNGIAEQALFFVHHRAGRMKEALEAFCASRQKNADLSLDTPALKYLWASTEDWSDFFLQVEQSLHQPEPPVELIWLVIKLMRSLGDTEGADQTASRFQNYIQGHQVPEYMDKKLS